MKEKKTKQSAYKTLTCNLERILKYIRGKNEEIELLLTSLLFLVAFSIFRQNFSTIFIELLAISSNYNFSIQNQSKN